MRMTCIGSAVAGALALILCLISLFSVTAAIGEVERLRSETVSLVEGGDLPAAKEKLVQLANRWNECTRYLELIAAHDDMHEVAAAIRDARVCLEMTDLDDLLRALEQVGTALEHIVNVQQVSWRNLY